MGQDDESDGQGLCHHGTCILVGKIDNKQGNKHIEMIISDSDVKKIKQKYTIESR